MDVSIIIVNYNTKKLLYNCLLSIQQQTQGLKYEIIVIDNGSIDGSIEFIHNFFPSIMIIPSPQNLGFGKANNLGAKYAIGKYLFFLNSDTILLNNAGAIFFNYMELHPNIGAIGCILMDENRKATFSYNDFPSIHSESKYIYNKIFHKTTIPQTATNEAITVDFISGADLFLPKIIFNQLNGFDPNFFMYYEDTDLQKRMESHNLKRCIIPQPHIIHSEGGSFKNKGLTYNRFILSQKSLNYYISKHFKGFSYYMFRFVMIFLRISIYKENWSWKERFQAYKQVFK